MLLRFEFEIVSKKFKRLTLFLEVKTPALPGTDEVVMLPGLDDCSGERHAVWEFKEGYLIPIQYQEEDWSHLSDESYTNEIEVMKKAGWQIKEINSGKAEEVI